MPSLDGIRALAIGGVFLLHLDRQHFPGGAFGVDVFFVLSAYLITSILLREIEGTGRLEFGAFYWRRFFRLAPALVLWLLCIATPTALLDHAGSSVPWSIVGALFYFNDFLQAWTSHVALAFDQSWSLAVEEQFYIVWPFLLALLVTHFQPRAQRRWIAGLVVLSIVVWQLAGNYFLPTGHLVPLALGCWAAFRTVHQVDGPLSSVFRDSRVALGCGVLFVVAACVTINGAWQGKAFSFLVDLAAMTLTLHCTLAPQSPVTKLLATAVPRWIGVRSYAIYLYGLTLIQLVPRLTHLSLHFAAPVDVLVTGLLVALSYRYVESPIRTSGRRWLKRRGESFGSVDPDSRIPGVSDEPV